MGNPISLSDKSPLERNIRARRSFLLHLVKDNSSSPLRSGGSNWTIAHWAAQLGSNGLRRGDTLAINLIKAEPKTRFCERKRTVRRRKT